MSSFSTDSFEILFNKDWKTRGLAEAIAAVDRNALCEEYGVLVKSAPCRSGKRYFVGHNGKLSGKGGSNRREEHLAVALWNFCGRSRWLRRPDGGRLRLLDYQFPLKARRSDYGIGKVDLLAATEVGRLVIIELKVKPRGGQDRGETPVKALIQGLRYAAIVEANQAVIAHEAQEHYKVRVSTERPIVQVLAPREWWKSWSELGDSTRRAAGAWETEFAQLTRDVGQRIGVAVEYVELDDLDGAAVTFGSDEKTPQLDRVPKLYPVRRF